LSRIKLLNIFLEYLLGLYLTLKPVATFI